MRGDESMRKGTMREEKTRNREEIRGEETRIGNRKERKQDERRQGVERK